MQEMIVPVIKINTFKGKQNTGFVDSDGAKVSFPVPITANIKSNEAKDRLIQERFTLRSGHYNRDQEYYLVIADQDDETKELHRYKFEIDISDMSY